MGLGEGGDYVKNKKFGTKVFFEITLNEILESCENYICWYKNWYKTRNKKNGSCILQFFTEVPSQNLQLIFHAAWYCPLRMGKMGKGLKGFLLKDQNLLSVTKVLCQGSLSGWLLSFKFISKSSSLVQRCKSFI